MTISFEVETDRRGRILHFIPNGMVQAAIQPEEVSESIDGGERIVHKAEEYDLTPDGNLIHPEVEVSSTVELGSGVLLGRGTSFHRLTEERVYRRERIKIGDRARVEGTKVHGMVDVGAYAVVLARTLGPGSLIGDYARIGLGTEVQADVDIGPNVKIDCESLIARGAQIEHASRLGYNTRVGTGAIIGHHSKIGRFQGSGSLGVNQDGEFIPAGQVLPPKTRR